jgi:hypothetical protein
LELRPQQSESVSGQGGVDWCPWANYADTDSNAATILLTKIAR